MELWNVKYLEPPPINSCKAPVKEIDVRFLNNTLKNAVIFFKNQKHLSSEAALLSRTVYRLKMKFRSSKDFKAMEKLHRALKIYLQIQIPKTLKTLLDSVPEKYKFNVTYLPTKHMIDFVLVRIQSLGKLLIRILETCKITCQLMQQRLRVGHFWKVAIMVYAMASRIYIIAKNMMKFICELYTDLLPLASKFGSVGGQWLPDGYVFPNNLSQWLNLDWMDIERDIVEIEDDEPAVAYFNLVDDSDDDVEFNDEYILVKDDDSLLDFKEDSKKFKSENDNVEEVITIDDSLVGFSEDIDAGEVINLNDTISSVEEQPMRKRKRHFKSGKKFTKKFARKKQF